jgi:hypothetical protein
VRFASSRSTSLWPTAGTRRNLVVRSAQIATDSASFGSFLFVLPVPNSRVRAASLGGTSTTTSPVAMADREHDAQHEALELVDVADHVAEEAVAELLQACRD